MRRKSEVVAPEPEPVVEAPQVGTALTTVSTELLARLLTLSPGVNVIGAEWDFPENCLRVYIRGVGVPKAEEGCLVPVVFPKGIMSKTDDKYTYSFEWEEAFVTPMYGGITVSAGN